MNAQQVARREFANIDLNSRVAKQSHFATRYEFDKGFFHGLGRLATAWAHNPFGSQDGYNKALQSRVFARDLAIAQKQASTEIKDAVAKEVQKKPAKNANVDLFAELLKQQVNLSVIESKVLPDFMALNQEAKDAKFIKKVCKSMNDLVNAHTRTDGKILAKTKQVKIAEHFKAADVQQVVISTLSEIVKETKANGTDKISFSDLTSELKDKVRTKLEAMLPPHPADAAAQSYRNAIKQETIFDVVLGIMERIFAVSPVLAYSLTAVTGIASFYSSLVLVVTTFPVTIPLLTQIFHQTVSYNTEGGPMSAREALGNIYKNLSESWKKAVEDPNSFHPLVEALLVSALFTGLAISVVRVCNALHHKYLYTLFDGFNQMINSYRQGDDRQTMAKKATLAFSKGFARGFIKDSLKPTAEINKLYTTGQAIIHDALITFPTNIGVEAFVKMANAVFIRSSSTKKEKVD